ncbi:hypothetical protein WJX73_004668 [Symbiochloris irregularis]|uniref:GBF-interacting protein 1 N-terminal domain-containing protein n=1 Tax=Symbiochloris irregularis TaxID=706552 RepID=A0AAW1PZD7_9CHLO
MATRARRGSGTTASAKDNGKDTHLERKVEAIREATGAAEEDIKLMLAECNNDVNETTSRLIDNPFTEVKTKKSTAKAREEGRNKEGSKVIEMRRPDAGGSGRGRGRGERPGRSFDRSGDRPHDRARSGRGPSPSISSSKPHENGAVASETSVDRDHLHAEEDKPIAAPIQRPTYSRAPGPASAASTADHSYHEPIRAAPGTPGAPLMSDLFKKKDPPAPRPPPAAIAPPSSSMQPGGDILDKPAPHSDLAALGGQAISPPTVNPKQIRPPSSAVASTSASTHGPAVPSSSHPASALSHQDAQVQAPGSKVSGGAAPSRYSTETSPPAVSSTATSAWGPPKSSIPPASASSPPVGIQPPQASLLGSGSGNIGSSLLSSLQASHTVAQPPAASDGLRLTAMSSSVDVPTRSPAKQRGALDLLSSEMSRSQPRAASNAASGDLSFQFGQFSLNPGAPVGSSFGSGFDLGRESLHQGAASLPAGSPSLHSLSASVSSAAAAAGQPFHKAPPSSGVDFSSSVGAPHRQTGFAPGFGPPITSTSGAGPPHQHHHHQQHQDAQRGDALASSSSSADEGLQGAPHAGGYKSADTAQAYAGGSSYSLPFSGAAQPQQQHQQQQSGAGVNPYAAIESSAQAANASATAQKSFDLGASYQGMYGAAALHHQQQQLQQQQQQPHANMPQMGSYGNVPPGMSNYAPYANYNPHAAAYAAGGMYSQPSAPYGYMPPYGAGGYSTPQSSFTPGMQHYGGVNSAYGAGHASSNPAHAKYSTYGQGYSGNGYDDGSSSTPGLAGAYAPHHGAAALPQGGPGKVGGVDPSSHGMHGQHQGLYAPHQQQQPYPNSARGMDYYGHAAYQGDQQGFDARRNYASHGHYPQGGPYKNS